MCGCDDLHVCCLYLGTRQLIGGSWSRMTIAHTQAHTRGHAHTEYVKQDGE